MLPSDTSLVLCCDILTLRCRWFLIQACIVALFLTCLAAIYTLGSNYDDIAQFNGIERDPSENQQTWTFENGNNRAADSNIIVPSDSAVRSQPGRSTHPSVCPGFQAPRRRLSYSVIFLLGHTRQI